MKEIIKYVLGIAIVILVFRVGAAILGGLSGNLLGIVAVAVLAWLVIRSARVRHR
ncbi:hypothetical protein GCM10009785_04410 [Brooklawnia cerclae]|uniref:Uncharacterized protein n=1 Tax=Brooklawnia cerclae TaxID=349934 RepID=A0ABX0SC59_9ACTN|nr:hypothetical protein [Brooklawnia cerclae]NIH55967.1 hypothetical protein [Brooklawnia cerclae]